MKNFMIAFRLMMFFTVLCGLVYPFFIWGFSPLFGDKPTGQLVDRDGKIIGSLLLAQKFTKPEYFWPRPSSVDYNPLPSGGSNLGPTAASLKEQITSRPQELGFASASGLDPHISPEAAKSQVARVAQARHLNQEDVLDLLKKHTQGRDGGLLGEPTVNVLALNLALDKINPSSP